MIGLLVELKNEPLELLLFYLPEILIKWHQKPVFDLQRDLSFKTAGLSLTTSGNTDTLDASGDVS